MRLLIWTSNWIFQSKRIKQWWNTRSWHNEDYPKHTPPPNLFSQIVPSDKRHRGGADFLSVWVHWFPFIRDFTLKNHVWILIWLMLQKTVFDLDEDLKDWTFLNERKVQCGCLPWDRRTGLVTGSPSMLHWFPQGCSEMSPALFSMKQCWAAIPGPWMLMSMAPWPRVVLPKTNNPHRMLISKIVCSQTTCPKILVAKVLRWS